MQSAKRNRASPEFLDEAPPSAVESERALLAGFLDRGRVDPDCDLRADQFYDRRNGAIYAAMTDLEAEFGAFDPTALVARLQRDPLWGRDGFDAAYVAETLTVAGNPAIGAYHSRQIKEAWRRRSVAREAEQLLRLSHNGFDANAMQEVLGRIGKAVSGTEKKQERFPLITSAALDSKNYTPIPIITEALFAGSPAVIGGGFKTGKTLLGIDAAISIATGRMFLGSFTVPEPRGVVYFTGEGGPTVAQEYGRRIAASKGIALADATQLRWCFSVPRLEDTGDLSAFAKVLDDTAAEVAILDNLMLCLSGDKAGNVYSMGGILGNVVRICSERGVTPVFVHHFKRTRATADQFAPGELPDLTQAGVAEIAGQWLLLARREPFDAAQAGEHRLWLTIGGRVGHSSLHALDVHEGSRADQGGRRWEVELTQADEARQDADSRQEEVKRKRSEERAAATLDSDRREIVGAAVKLKDPETKNGIRDRVAIPHKRFPAAFASLVSDGSLQPAAVTRTNGHQYEGWKVRDEQ